MCVMLAVLQELHLPDQGGHLLSTHAVLLDTPETDADTDTHLVEVPGLLDILGIQGCRLQLGVFC